jgi:hypothetical protein
MYDPRMRYGNRAAVQVADQGGQRHGRVVGPLAGPEMERAAARDVREGIERARRLELDGRAQCIANGQPDQGAAVMVLRVHEHRREYASMVGEAKVKSPYSSTGEAQVRLLPTGKTRRRRRPGRPGRPASTFQSRYETCHSHGTAGARPLPFPLVPVALSAYWFGGFR